LEVQQQLQQRAAERFPAIVVYVLVALLLLLAGTLLWLWSRQRRLGKVEERSWTQTAAPDKGAFAQEPMPVVVPTAYVDHSVRLQPTEPELLPSGMMPLEFGPPPATAPKPTEPSLPLAAFAGSAGLAPVTAVVNPED